MGITPAYAGKSAASGSPRPAAWDHPRIRGEKSSFTTMMTRGLGSPPHTRGKAVYVHICRINLGITPAYAGKRAVQRPVHIPSEDHPRIRGEKLNVYYIKAQRQESPPHTRGKDERPRGLYTPIGITPAYAGKSKSTCSGGVTSEDHPRIRGEKIADVDWQDAAQGSPPHTRGKGKKAYKNKGFLMNLFDFQSISNTTPPQE